MIKKDKAEIIATKIWQWIKKEQQIDFVPWVLNPESTRYDSEKATISKTRNKLLGDLEAAIIQWSKELDK